jgi:hypothetical protein
VPAGPAPGSHISRHHLGHPPGTALLQPGLHIIRTEGPELARPLAQVGRHLGLGHEDLQLL